MRLLGGGGDQTTGACSVPVKPSMPFSESFNLSSK